MYSTMQARNLFLLVVYISPLIVNSAPIQLNMTRHDHRRLLPFNPDPGGNVTCIGAGDPACGAHGECIANWLSHTNWTCRCNQGWFTRHVDALNHTLTCTIEQPNQLTALLLQIFLGWISVGAFYLGWNIYATISFMVMGGVCTMSCCLGLLSSKKTKERDASLSQISHQVSSTYSMKVNDDSDEKGCVSSCGSCAVVTAIITMWVVNLVLIINDCHNKEGIPCLPM
jgi:hypothetical protein